MIRTNLATRPFYNESAVRLWLGVAALIVVAATIFNASRLLRYTTDNSLQAQAAERDERRARELRDEASRLRASVDIKQVEFASTEARQANDLIDRRTFSWTELFNHFETTLPDDVRIVSVRPRLNRDRGFVLLITVMARGVEDVNAFMENLEKTGAFLDAGSKEEHINEQGQLEAQLETNYVPMTPAPAAPKPAAGAGKGQQ
jgi:type IV pilus assembly protein PilN